MKCPACGAAALIHEIRDIEYTYKGEKTLLPSIEGDYCPACGESIHDKVATEQIGTLLKAFQKRVNASIVDPLFVANARRRLNLDQREAAAIFGGGVNAFSRYETGKTKPPLALVQLLKLLQNHPELLEEIK